jgi:IclR family transcriptional regulator, acetate operon repressor
MIKKKTKPATEQPIDRAFAVLTAVTKATGPASITAIAEACDLPVPTAHRLVAQLERRGLLKRALGSKKVVVGANLLRIGQAALEAAMRTDRPHQILLALSTKIGEHCQTGLRSNNEVLYIDTAQAVRSLGLHFEQGGRAPLHCTSIGKLFLAEMGGDEFDWWLSNTPLPALTPHTITSPAVLRTVVAEVKTRGWAASNEELALGVVGCAVPIRNAEGQLVVGLGISVPSARVAFDQLTQFRSAMEAAADAIEIAIADR